MYYYKYDTCKNLDSGIYSNNCHYFDSKITSDYLNDYQG
jgi:hypothetical protein